MGSGDPRKITTVTVAKGPDIIYRHGGLRFRWGGSSFFSWSNRGGHHFFFGQIGGVINFSLKFPEKWGHHFFWPSAKKMGPTFFQRPFFFKSHFSALRALQHCISFFIDNFLSIFQAIMDCVHVLDGCIFVLFLFMT